MSRMDARYISLIGKMIAKYQVMSDLMEYEDHERDILRNALTEYNFYHAHERVEAPASDDVVQEPGVKQTRKPTLGLSKPTR